MSIVSYHCHGTSGHEGIDGKGMMRVVVRVGSVDQELGLVSVDVLCMAVWNRAFGGPLDDHLLAFLAVRVDKIQLKRTVNCNQGRNSSLCFHQKSKLVKSSTISLSPKIVPSPLFGLPKVMQKRFLPGPSDLLGRHLHRDKSPFHRLARLQSAGQVGARFPG